MPNDAIAMEEHNGRGNEGIFTMVYTIIVVLVILWLLGLIGHVAGGLIHLLLVAALILFIYNLVTGRKTRV